MSFKWLQQSYPRYLRPRASTLQIQVHDQEVNHLTFPASSLALQDCLVLSDGQARVRVYSIVPGNSAATCVWQSSGHGSTGPATSFSRDMGLWQGMFVAVAAQRSIELWSLAKLPSSAGTSCHSTITTPLEGCYNIAWDPLGSFIVLCTAIRRLRLYHDKGNLCTEVDSVSDTSMAVFAPGDATMLYCVTPKGVKLRSLRSLPECADFCQAVDRSRYHASTATGKAHAAELQKRGAAVSSFVDPASSCWLPTSPVPAPRLQHDNAPAEPECTCSCHKASSSAVCGCTEDHPCHAGCANMQQNSTTLRTPLTTMAAANGQTATRQAGRHDQGALCMTDGTPTAATACKAAGTAAKAFSRQKRQQSSAGKRKADLSWLQGDDDATPASSTKQQHFSYPVHAWATSDSLLCESTEAEAHPDSNEANDTELKLLNGVVTWYTTTPNAAENARFDSKAGRYQYSFRGHTGAVTQVLPLSDGLHILTSSNDNTHKLWTVEGKGLCTFKPLADAGNAFASVLSACQKFVMAGHGSSTYVWDVHQVLQAAGEAPDSHSYGNHLIQLQDHECMITAIACSHSMLAAADSSGKVTVRFSS